MSAHAGGFGFICLDFEISEDESLIVMPTYGNDYVNMTLIPKRFGSGVKHK